MKKNRIFVVIWILIGIALLFSVFVANQPMYTSMQKNISSLVKIYSVVTLIYCVILAINILLHRIHHR